MKKLALFLSLFVLANDVQCKKRVEKEIIIVKKDPTLKVKVIKGIKVFSIFSFCALIGFVGGYAVAYFDKAGI